MNPQIKLFSMLVAIVALSACTSIPTGPEMLTLPGTGKSFDQFRSDEGNCRQYAIAQIGGSTGNDAAANNGVKARQSLGDDLQQRYDFAYIQCMYAKGHRVPVSGNFEDSKRPASRCHNADRVHENYEACYRRLVHGHRVSPPLAYRLLSREFAARCGVH